MEAGKKLSLHAFEVDNPFTSDDSLIEEANQLLMNLSDDKLELLKEKHL